MKKTAVAVVITASISGAAAAEAMHVSMEGGGGRFHGDTTAPPSTTVNLPQVLVME